METKDKKLLKVRKNLHKISSDKLDEVNDFLEFLLKKNSFSLSRDSGVI